MSIESRIEAGGRWVLRSPLWTGLAVTLFFVLPTLLIPTVPLWVSAVAFVTIGPPVVVALYVLYGIYGRLFGWRGTPDTADAAATDELPDDIETPVDRLKYRYAQGEIDESTFERRLEQLMETEDLAQRLDDRQRAEPEVDLQS